MQFELQELVSEFAVKLVAAVESEMRTRIMSALNLEVGVRAGRKAGVASLEFAFDGSHRQAAEAVVKKPRKLRAKQFCLVPGCKGVAAPTFGMVCRDHRDLPKTKIAKYRQARLDAKQGTTKVTMKAVKKAAKKAVTTHWKGTFDL